MVTLVCGKSYKKTKSYLERALEVVHLGWLDKYGAMGVEALSAATPVDTGKTASSWYYEIERNGANATLVWKNSNINKGVPIALVIQYGHALPSGVYIQGIDYINPAMAPIFNQIAEEVAKEVKNL